MLFILSFYCSFFHYSISIRSHLVSKSFHVKLKCTYTINYMNFKALETISFMCHAQMMHAHRHFTRNKYYNVITLILISLSLSHSMACHDDGYNILQISCNNNYYHYRNTYCSLRFTHFKSFRNKY